MELTKQDRKHINDEVTRLAFRINIESQEYARLYEKEYLEALIRRIEESPESLEQVTSFGMRASQPPTNK